MKEKATAFAVGATGYPCIEILARGHTHWSMALLGGICVLALVWIARRYPGMNIAVQAALGTAFITAAELAVGLVVNRALGWQVWDYSREFAMCWDRYAPCSAFTGSCCACPCSACCVWPHAGKPSARLRCKARKTAPRVQHTGRGFVLTQGHLAICLLRYSLALIFSIFLKMREKCVTSAKPTASLTSQTLRAGSASSSFALAMRTPLSRSKNSVPCSWQ